MNKKAKVLIFPAGSENALDIYESLKYNLHFIVFGASGKKDHAAFIYPKDKLYIGDLDITQNGFLDEFNKVLDQYMIDYVIPTHDEIALFLTENESEINATLVCSPYETARIAVNKKLSFEALREFPFIPKIYQRVDEITKYPVFLKPYVGAGGKGTYLVENGDELEQILSNNSNLLICEYLPGKEFTIDCFTNKKGDLLFFGPRTRERITMGLTFHSERVECNHEFGEIARAINAKFKIRGTWFFQVKEDEGGHLKFMEFAVRQAGTMTFYRQLGINFAALSLFDFMDYDVKVLFNDYKLTLDRSLQNCYHLDHDYDKVYIDFDDTLIVGDQVNTILMKFIYQCVNSNKQVILISKHTDDLEESFKRYRINRELFDEIILVEDLKNKADYISASKAVFIDNHFPERVAVSEKCKIPVFDVDAVECLIDSSVI